MRRTGIAVVLVVVSVLAVQMRQPPARTQTLPPVFGAHAVTIAPATSSDVRIWDDELFRLRREGRLRLVRERDDTMMAGRQHERLAQYHEGLLVFGAEVTRQTDNRLPVSMIGTLYRQIDVPTTPRLSVAEARDVMLGQSGAVTTLGTIDLLILPLETGAFALAYRVVTTFSDDILVSFVDALSGRILLQFSDLQTQVGRGRGVLGDTKKISTESSGGSFRTADTLRPPAIQTYDMRGDITRVLEVLNQRTTLGPADLAVDADNDWTDTAVVDGHVYAGWTYDYYFKRFGRRGLDNNDLPIRSLVHPIARDSFTPATFQQYSTFFANAFWSGALRLMVYGDGLPSNATLNSQQWNFLSGALDVVAHELTHGVTQFSSNLTYLGEAGALNEAFSDMMAAGAEFYYAAARGRAGNYLVGEDVITPGGLRSMENPRAYQDPDHYSIRQTGPADNAGVHTNSGIPNHVFYLAIEGGTNRTSGLSVQGVGGANREQIEKVFYRAFTTMLPASANFYLARLATIQSARDLYGAGGAVERAVTQAWDAVGVQTQAASLTFLFSPDPVPPAPVGACPLTRPNFQFLVGIAEVGGVGFNVTSSQIRFYNAAGALSSAQALNFAQIFASCTPGSNRINPISLPCASLCVTLGGAAGGFVDFTVAGVDDLGNQGTYTSPRLLLGTTAAATEAPVQGTYMSVGR